MLNYLLIQGLIEYYRNKSKTLDILQIIIA